MPSDGFAATLQRIRTARGLTQEALAARAKVSRPYITMLERGKGDPSLAVLRRLARALDVPVAVLLS